MPNAPCPVIAVTLGDPCGIGPEIASAALREPHEGARFVVLGPESLLKPFSREDVEAIPTGGGTFTPGRPDIESGRAAIAAIDRACDLAMKGEVAGIVTGPVSKQHITATERLFQGHTEYLAARCGVRRAVMMFVGERWKVSLVTTHVAIRKIPQALTAEAVSETIRGSAEGLRRFFGVMEPRLAVCGLNPHAGEGGQFGRDESEVIEPGMELARASGVRCEGPFSADTIFRREGFDAIVAMFHDQALPVIKTADPLSVNVTLGLPFIRTSPDHGTAFDIAGRGVADPAPMRRAIDLAARLARSSASLL